MISAGGSPESLRSEVSKPLHRCWAAVLVAFSILNRIFFLCECLESLGRRFPVFCHFTPIILFHCYLDMFPSHSFDSGDWDNKWVSACLEETRNSQEWLCSVKFAWLHSAPIRLCRLAGAGILWQASLFLLQAEFMFTSGTEEVTVVPNIVT